MPNCDGFIFKVDGIPSQTENFAATQAVERGRNNAKLSGVSLKNLKQLFNLCRIVEVPNIFIYRGQLHFICWI